MSGMDSGAVLWVFLFGLVILVLRIVANNRAQRRVSRIITNCIDADIVKRDLELAKAHGCRSPPRLLNRRPLGVDRIEQIFRANAESRLMELFLFHFRLWGTTLEQIFLGTRAFGTIEPANLEAILSTNFQGKAVKYLSGTC